MVANVLYTRYARQRSKRQNRMGRSNQAIIVVAVSCFANRITLILMLSRFGNMGTVVFGGVVWLGRFFEFQCSADAGEDGTHAEAERLGSKAWPRQTTV